MTALVWIGVVLLVLGILAWATLKAALWLGVLLVLVGIGIIVWGAVAAKRAL